MPAVWNTAACSPRGASASGRSNDGADGGVRLQRLSLLEIALCCSLVKRWPPWASKVERERLIPCLGHPDNGACYSRIPRKQHGKKKGKKAIEQLEEMQVPGAECACRSGALAGAFVTVWKKRGKAGQDALQQSVVFFPPSIVHKEDHH